MPIKITVTGSCGKMGSETVKTILKEANFKLAGAIDRSDNQGSDIGLLAGIGECGVKISGSLDEVITNTDCLVDFSNAEISPYFIKTALKNNVNCIVGTTGIKSGELDEISKIAEEKGKAVLIVPNFSIGAILMMKFAKEASRYFKSAEIVELHHDKKQDSPSGTSIMTAKGMNEERAAFERSETKNEIIDGARGGSINGIGIHSVRLPGMVAHQQVIMGGNGEILTIKHDSMSRSCFMPGLVLAINRIDSLKGLLFGLEHVMD